MADHDVTPPVAASILAAYQADVLRYEAYFGQLLSKRGEPNLTELQALNTELINLHKLSELLKDLSAKVTGGVDHLKCEIGRGRNRLIEAAKSLGKEVPSTSCSSASTSCSTGTGGGNAGNENVESGNVENGRGAPETGNGDPEPPSSSSSFGISASTSCSSGTGGGNAGNGKGAATSAAAPGSASSPISAEGGRGAWKGGAPWSATRPNRSWADEVEEEENRGRPPATSPTTPVLQFQEIWPGVKISVCQVKHFKEAQEPEKRGQLCFHTAYNCYCYTVGAMTIIGNMPNMVHTARSKRTTHDCVYEPNVVRRYEQDFHIPSWHPRANPDQPLEALGRNIARRVVFVPFGCKDKDIRENKETTVFHFGDRSTLLNDLANVSSDELLRLGEFIILLVALYDASYRSLSKRQIKIPTLAAFATK